MEKSPPVLATIGYEGASMRDFLAALRDAGVTTLIDGRAAPYSKGAVFPA